MRDRPCRWYSPATGSASTGLRRAREIGEGPLGYWGLSLGTQYGLPFLARSPEMVGAVLGLFRNGPRVAHYARRVAYPIFFVRQEADEIHPAELVGELYENFASEDKRLASSPGAHADVPEPVCQAAFDFMLRQLGVA